MNEIAKRIFKLLEVKGITPYRAAKDLSINQSTFTDWKRSRSNPSADKITILADYLGVSTDFLLNGDAYKMSIYERIKNVLDQKGISAYRAANDLGIDQSTFTRWKKGAIPSTELLNKISEYLGVSITYFLYGETDEGTFVDSNNKKNRKTLIPVLGFVPCGVPVEAIEDIIEWIEVVPGQERDHFGLIAKGDSMHPFIMEGDILIIRQQPCIDSGKIAIVKVNGDDATCKKVIQNSEGMTLVPMNPVYDPVTFTNQEIEEKPVTIIGEVVEIRRRF